MPRVPNAKSGAMQKKDSAIELVHWDIRCRVNSLANDFVNNPPEPVFCIGVKPLGYNPEVYPTDFNTPMSVAYVRLSDVFSNAIISVASAAYFAQRSVVIKFNQRVLEHSHPKNGELRVQSIQIQELPPKN